MTNVLAYICTVCLVWPNNARVTDGLVVCRVHTNACTDRLRYSLDVHEYVRRNRHLASDSINVTVLLIVSELLISIESPTKLINNET